MKKALLFFAILLTSYQSVFALTDSSKITPDTRTPGRTTYVLSRGSYQTRCHWAHANSSNDNNGYANCKAQRVSDSLCYNRYYPTYHIGVLATTGHKASYFDAIVVDPNPILESYDERGGYVPYYVLKFFRSGSYLDAKALWHEEDDGDIILAYTLYCVPY